MNMLLSNYIPNKGHMYNDNENISIIYEGINVFLFVISCVICFWGYTNCFQCGPDYSGTWAMLVPGFLTACVTNVLLLIIVFKKRNKVRLYCRIIVILLILNCIAFIIWPEL